jgi:hypothetical protein
MRRSRLVVSRVAAAAGAGGGAARRPPAAVAGARAASDFAYVVPGPVAPRRHVLRFRESERGEVWKHEGIPVLDDGLPEAARGRLVQHYMQVSEDAEDAIVASLSKSHSLGLVHALLDHLREDGGPGALPLSDAELREVTAEPTPEEAARLATPAGRRAALRALRGDVDALLASAADREADALDSGEVDLALPLPVERREALQAAASKGLLLSALRVARVVSLVHAAQDDGMSVADRALLADAIDAANGPLHLGVAPPTMLQALGGDVAPGDAPMTPDEVAEFAHGDAFEQHAQAALLHGDRMEHMPRKALPPPLHANAPSAFLEDAARVLEGNPSYASPEDRAYVMSYYADAVGGKAEAFDGAADKAAYLDPQPQWGVYDPELVKKQARLWEGAGAAERRGALPCLRPRQLTRFSLVSTNRPTIPSHGAGRGARRAAGQGRLLARARRRVPGRAGAAVVRDAARRPQPVARGADGLGGSRRPDGVVRLQRGGRRVRRVGGRHQHAGARDGATAGPARQGDVRQRRVGGRCGGARRQARRAAAAGWQAAAAAGR